MTDGGLHFNNAEVNEYCRQQGIEHITTPAYSPWANGLIENANKILLGRLKHLCAPDLEDVDGDEAEPIAMPAQWSEHLDEAIRSMEDRILPALGFTPRELLWGRWETMGDKEQRTSETGSSRLAGCPDTMGSRATSVSTMKPR